MRHIDYIVIHATGTTGTAKVSSIQNYWKNTLKWKTGGYHYIIETSGKVHTLYPLSRVTNGVQGFNSQSVHICYIGGIDAEGNEVDTRTYEQKEAILGIFPEIYAELSEHQDVDDILIRGHRDFSPDKDKDGELTANEWLKTCPCFDVLDEYWWVQGSKAMQKGRFIIAK